jgi:hypothetical protein
MIASFSANRQLGSGRQAVWGWEGEFQRARDEVRDVTASWTVTVNPKSEAKDWIAFMATHCYSIANFTVEK